MSWHCSQALVEAFSQANVWVTGSCVRWKKMRIAERSLCGGKKTTASPSSQSGTTLTPSTGTPGMALSMSFLLASHAKGSPLQESNLEQTTPETSGPPQQGSSEKYVQAELFSKTYQESESTSESWPKTLPIWGSIVNGELSPLEKPELCTLESGGGAWPTPTVNTRPNEGNVRLLRKQVLDGNLSEEEATQMLNGKSPFSAQGAVKAWPTPTVSDSGGGARPAQQGEKGWYNVNKDGTRWGAILRDAVPAHEKKWPTSLEPHNKGKLNPDWVEWLMGWPIGWTSLDFINLDMKRWWNYSMITEPAKYWEDDPADIPVGMKYHTPRLTTKKEYRAERLKACGNGQVPQQLLLAWKQLKKAAPPER